MFTSLAEIQAYFSLTDHPTVNEEFQAFWEGLSWNQRYQFKFSVWDKMTPEEKTDFAGYWGGLNNQARIMFIKTRLGEK